MKLGYQCPLTAIEASTSPLAKHHPHVRTASPTIKRRDAVLVPPFDAPPLPRAHGTTGDWAIEFHEWLSLVLLGSSRVEAKDDIDAYLCRYSVPQEEAATPTNLVHLQYSGFMPAQWIRTLFLELM